MQPEDGRRQHARRWLEEAHGDLESARFQASRADLPARIACFLAHLATEKALKALLVDAGIAFARVHSLLELRADLPESIRDHFDVSALASLNPWAIAGRYPGDLADADHALASDLIGHAELVVQTVEQLLRSPSPA